MQNKMSKVSKKSVSKKQGEKNLNRPKNWDKMTSGEKAAWTRQHNQKHTQKPNKPTTTKPNKPNKPNTAKPKPNKPGTVAHNTVHGKVIKPGKGLAGKVASITKLRDLLEDYGKANKTQVVPVLSIPKLVWAKDGANNYLVIEN